MVNIMNYRNLTITAIFLIIMMMISCTDDSQHGPYGSDNIAPGPVVVNNILNTAGGAVIYFTPPNDEDLLYVKASFEDENSIVLSNWNGELQSERVENPSPDSINSSAWAQG